LRRLVVIVCTEKGRTQTATFTRFDRGLLIIVSAEQRRPQGATAPGSILRLGRRRIVVWDSIEHGGVVQYGRMQPGPPGRIDPL
jgi:hypothetical protein